MYPLTNFTGQSTDSLSQSRYVMYNPSTPSQTRLTVITTGESVKIREKISTNTVNVHGVIGTLDKKTIEGVALLTTISELSSLLTRIINKYPELGHPTLNVVYNPDTSEPAFIEIIFPDGDWEKWRRVVKEVKGELRKAGLEDLAAKVAITCLRGLRE